MASKHLQNFRDARGGLHGLDLQTTPLAEAAGAHDLKHNISS